MACVKRLVNKKRYEEIVQGFAGRKVVVLGDLMMDEYLWGRATRISPESPVMVVDVDRETSVPGGAANVVNNLLALGASVSVVGVVGEDAAGIVLRAELEHAGADVAGIVVDADRPTTRKTRIVAHNQQVLRVDREQADPVSNTVAAQVVDGLKANLDGAHALLISDYFKGVVTHPIARTAIEMARERNIIVTANPKPPSAAYLAGADVVQLNQSEAEMAAVIMSTSNGVTKGAFSEPLLDASGAALSNALDIETLAVTRGSKGLSLWRRSGKITHVPAHPAEVYDVAGAGDTVISTLTLAMAGGAPVEEAAVVATHAASCVIRKVGVATVTPAELLADYRGPKPA